MRATTLFIASAAVLAMGSQAQINGQIASLDSADNYCFFLPPMIGGDIAANEDKAIAFCNKPNPKAPGAKIFPPGFVLSAHWATGKDWIQITVRQREKLETRRDRAWIKSTYSFSSCHTTIRDKSTLFSTS